MLLLILKVAVRMKINKMNGASKRQTLQIGSPAHRTAVNCSRPARRFHCHMRHERGAEGGGPDAPADPKPVSNGAPNLRHYLIIY